jgi:hypothetical protein
MMIRALLLVAVVAILSGCAFGTDHVRLPALAIERPPAQGDQVSVLVKDARADLSGSLVGFKRNGYGAKTGDVSLMDKEVVADRISRDIVSILRARGLRAYEVSELLTERADAILGVELASFLIDSKMGFWSGELQGMAVLRVKLMRADSKKTVWDEVIRAEAKKDGLMAIVESDRQEVADKLYKDLIEKLRHQLPSEVPR